MMSACNTILPSCVACSQDAPQVMMLTAVVHFILQTTCHSSSNCYKGMYMHLDTYLTNQFAAGEGKDNQVWYKDVDAGVNSK